MLVRAGTVQAESQRLAHKLAIFGEVLGVLAVVGRPQHLAVLLGCLEGAEQLMQHLADEWTFLREVELHQPVPDGEARPANEEEPLELLCSSWQALADAQQHMALELLVIAAVIVDLLGCSANVERARACHKSSELVVSRVDRLLALDKITQFEAAPIAKRKGTRKTQIKMSKIEERRQRESSKMAHKLFCCCMIV